jgi:hypothetical protein
VSSPQDPDLAQALAYWDTQAAIYDQQLAAVALLAAPPDAAQRVYDAWWPYYRWREQLREGEQPLEPWSGPPTPELPL